MQRYETDRPDLIIWFAILTVPGLRGPLISAELSRVPKPLVRPSTFANYVKYESQSLWFALFSNPGATKATENLRKPWKDLRTHFKSLRKLSKTFESLREPPNNLTSRNLIMMIRATRSESTDRQTDRQTDRHTERHTERERERDRDRHTHTRKDRPPEG